MAREPRTKVYSCPAVTAYWALMADGGPNAPAHWVPRSSGGALYLLLRHQSVGAVRSRCESTFFFPEIEAVGFSLDSLPGLGSTFRHFAVTLPRFRPRPQGSIHLVFKPLTVPSNRRLPLIWKSRFSAIHYNGSAANHGAAPLPNIGPRISCLLCSNWRSQA